MADRQFDAGDLLMLEARGGHVDVITSGRQIGRPIDAGDIGLTGPGDDARIGIGNGDGGSPDGAPWGSVTMPEITPVTPWLQAKRTEKRDGKPIENAEPMNADLYQL